MNGRNCIIPFVAIALIALAACRGGEHASAGAGNTLVIALKSSPTNLDSRVGNDNASGRIGDLIYSALVKVTPEMDYAPDLATKWEMPDEKTLIFHLKPAARFHNGQPVTANDVKWTYDSLLAAGFMTSKKSGYAALDHIEAPDAHTVIFKLKEPNGGFFDNLTVGILPAGADTNVYKTRPIGAGPYKIVDYRADDRIELEAFDQWHGGKARIKHVTIRIIPDMTTAVLELRRGSVNFEVNVIPFENVPDFEKSSDFAVVKKPGSIYQYIAFNLRDPILSKKPVRQAIAHAIDRQRIIRDLQHGYAVPAETLFGEGHWARADGLTTYAYDPGMAKQLLDRAGYPDPDGDGPRTRFTLVLKTSTDAEANLRAQAIQQMLKQVGIDLQIQSNEMSTFYDDIQKGKFQMYSLSRNGIQDPDFYYVIFYSKNTPPQGQNRGYYANPRVDQLIVEGRTTFDRAKRKAIYDEIQKIAADELPYVSLYHQANVAVMRKNIDGYVMYPAGFLLSVPEMEMR